LMHGCRADEPEIQTSNAATPLRLFFPFRGPFLLKQRKVIGIIGGVGGLDKASL
jgi:hypothetical protein